MRRFVIVLVACGSTATPKVDLDVGGLPDDDVWDPDVTTPSEPPAHKLVGGAVHFAAAAADEELGDDLVSAIPKVCGTKRVRVKMGADPDAAGVKLRAKKGDIGTLGTVTPPKLGSSLPRTGPVEHTVFTLRNVKLTFAREEGDHDYHLALSDGSHTLVAEVVDPSCLDAVTDKPWLARQKAARASVESAMTITKEGGTHDAIVTVVGVGFFDTIHGGEEGQVGHAPNGVELHPVLAICFGPDCKLGSPHRP